MNVKRLLAAPLAAAILSVPAWAADAPQPTEAPKARNAPAANDPTANLPVAEAGVLDLTRPFQGYRYYNKPGENIETHNADLKYCASIAALGVQPREVMPAAGGILGMIISAAITQMEIKRGIAANTESCMMVRGWRVVQVPDDEGQGLAKLDQASLEAQLQAWVGLDPPHGQVERSWDNDLAKGKTLKFREAGPDPHPSLSIVAMAKDLDAPAPRPAPGPRPPRSAQSPPSLSADRLAGINLKPDEALVIVRIRHPGLSKGLGVVLERMGPDPDTPAWYADQKPFVLAVARGLLFTNGDGQDYAYIVPAGVWRLDSINEPFYSISFCFGAPAFTVKGGDVIFAGTFDLGADYIGPDVTLDPAKALLAKAPQLQAALQPAQWKNGYTAPCRGTYFYDYEMTGVPMIDGYIRGEAPFAKTKDALQNNSSTSSLAVTKSGS